MAKDFNCSARYGCQHAFDNKVFKQDDSSSSSLEGLCVCSLLGCVSAGAPEIMWLLEVKLPYFSQKKKKKWNRHREMSLQISTKEDPRKLFWVSWPGDKKRLWKCKLVIQCTKILIVFLCDCQCISKLSLLRSSLLHFLHLPWLSSHNLDRHSPPHIHRCEQRSRRREKEKEKKTSSDVRKYNLLTRTSANIFYSPDSNPPWAFFLQLSWEARAIMHSTLLGGVNWS